MGKNKKKKNKKSNVQMDHQNLLSLKLLDDSEFDSYLNPTSDVDLEGLDFEEADVQLGPTELELREFVKAKFAEAGILVRYNPITDEWYVFDGLVWQKDIRQLQLMENILKVFQTAYEDKTQTAFTEDEVKRWHSYTTSTTAKKIITILKSDKEMQEIHFDEVVDEIVVANGVINLRTSKLMKPDPFKFHTIKKDVVYNNDDEKYKKSDFVRVMNETVVVKDDATGLWIPDEAKIKTLQNFMGYGLTGETKEQKLLICIGDGGNGKSVLLNSVLSLMGPYAMTLPMSQLMTKKGFNDSGYFLEKAQGKRLIVASECGEGDELDEGLVKMMTGGGKISARQIRKEPIEFTPHFKIIMDTNVLPVISDSYAIERRLVIVRFPRTFTPDEIDPDLEAKLATPEEQSAMLTWLVKGAKRYYDKGKVKIHDSVQDETARILFENQSATYFAKQLKKIEEREDAKVSAAELFDIYKNFCSQAGMRAQSTKALANALAKVNILKKRSNSGVVYQGFDADDIRNAFEC